MSENKLLDAARAYHSAGFRVVPIPAGEKGPRFQGWPDLRIPEGDLHRHFNGAGNIGLVLGAPSGDLVDIDLDSDEAVALADEYLPPTPAVTGRGKRPRSHRWYIAAGMKTKKFVDPETGQLHVEIRSTGAQTVVGPSTHPDGDAYDLLEHEPAAVDAEVLRAAVEALHQAVLRKRGIKPPTPPQPQRASQSVRSEGRREAAYARQALERECAAVETAAEGTRNHTLNVAAFNLGQGVGGGWAEREEVEAALLRSAMQSGLEKNESMRTIRSGIESGLNKPRRVPEASQRGGEAADPPTDASQVTAGAPAMVRLCDVEPEEVRWLWPARIPAAKLTVIGGDPGLGKSFAVYDIIARVTSGAAWPDESDETGRRPAGALIVTAEDGLADTVVPRLRMQNADMDRVQALDGVTRGDGKVGEFTLEDIEPLRKAIENIADCAVVMLDPVSAFMGRADSHNNAEVREVLKGLNRIAEETGAAIIAISHLSKSGAGEKKAVYRMMGSLAFTAAPRAVWAVARDPDDQERRILANVKMNLGRPASAIAYHIDNDGLHWSRDKIEGSIDDILDARGSGNAQPARQEAARFLLAKLADGEMSSDDLKERAKEEGIAIRTLDRAKDDLGIKPFKKGWGGTKLWIWRLPEDLRETVAQAAASK